MSGQTVEAGAGGKTSGVSVSAPTERPSLPVRTLRGVWRVAVAEESMEPALRSGDWLLIDPTVRAWPRRGAIVVFREPVSGLLAVKRVAARPGDRVRISEGWLRLGPDQAWLIGDNTESSIDSRRYGPVQLDALLGRAWFCYYPVGRIGPLRRGLRP
jgi:signal peptidase I